MQVTNKEKMTFFEKASVIFGVLSILIPIAIYYLTRPPKLNIEARVYTPNNLIDIKGVEDLSAKLFYKGVAVNNFWISRVDIVNTGSGTVVGRGVRSHLVNGFLEIVGNPGCRILGVDLKKNEFAQIFASNNVIRISFDQWHKDELVSFDVLAEMQKGKPSFNVRGRPITDGVCNAIPFNMSAKHPTDRYEMLLMILLAILTVMTAIVTLIGNKMNSRIRIKQYERIEQLLKTQREMFKKMKKLQKLASKQARERDSLQDN